MLAGSNDTTTIGRNANFDVLLSSWPHHVIYSVIHFVMKLGRGPPQQAPTACLVPTASPAAADLFSIKKSCKIEQEVVIFVGYSRHSGKKRKVICTWLDMTIVQQHVLFSSMFQLVAPQKWFKIEQQTGLLLATLRYLSSLSLLEVQPSINLLVDSLARI